jgi:hypothetical protein
MYHDLESGGYYFIFLGKTHNGTVLKKSLELIMGQFSKNPSNCPIMSFARKKKIISRTFQISGTLIVKLHLELHWNLTEPQCVKCSFKPSQMWPFWRRSHHGLLIEWTNSKATLGTLQTILVMPREADWSAPGGELSLLFIL